MLTRDEMCGREDGAWCEIKGAQSGLRGSDSVLSPPHLREQRPRARPRILRCASWVRRRPGGTGRGAQRWSTWPCAGCTRPSPSAAPAESWSPGTALFQLPARRRAVHRKSKPGVSPRFRIDSEQGGKERTSRTVTGTRAPSDAQSAVMPCFRASTPVLRVLGVHFAGVGAAAAVANERTTLARAAAAGDGATARRRSDWVRDCIADSTLPA